MTEPAASTPFADYEPEPFFCELTGRRGTETRFLERIRTRLAGLDIATLMQRAREAENELFNLGITFTVYSDKDAIDRILPFDVIPRILTAAEWAQVESGVIQRVKALNLFLWDIYHDQKILKNGVVPRELVLTNRNYRPEMAGLDPPGGTYIHINGTDIVRDRHGTFQVLEDNGRAPSGVSTTS